MASRYDLARADAELALARLGVQKATTDLNEQSAALAALVEAPGWRPQPVNALGEVRAQLDEGDASLADNPALRLGLLSGWTRTRDLKPLPRESFREWWERDRG